DRTSDFRRLAGISIGKPPFQPLEGSFMWVACEQKLRLAALGREIEREGASTAAIHACQDEMLVLERTAEDLSDLGELVPVQMRDQVAHRRGLISGLYEELQKLASRVQSEQVQDLQREAQVASFFTSAPSSSSRAPKLKPPPPPSAEDLAGWSSGGGGSGGASKFGLDAEMLRAEEQRLLSTFTTDLDKIQETQSKIEEVSAMVGLFATKVAEQTEQADQILDLAEESTAYIETAEKHLQKAVQNSNAYRFYVVCWFVGSASFLLVFDFIDARYSLI
ncbi:unnamed protein product, partial [Polarella glacialis]